MATDINGKGFLVGNTVTLATTVIGIAPAAGGKQVIVRRPSGAFSYTNVPKNLVSSYAVGSTVSLTGTVAGFVNGGALCVFQEADGNEITAECNTVTAT